MSMWISADAINAEVEYRREQHLRLASLARISRQVRAARAERRRSAGAEHRRDERENATGERIQLAAQRIAGSSRSTKQPV